MHIDLFALTLKNVAFLSLTAIVITSETMPPFQEELQRIWKTLTAPILLLKKETNHKSKSFWELDMTKFEP